MRVQITLFLLLCCASGAGAQTTFVSGSLVGEIARFGFIDADPVPYVGPNDLSLDGEAVGFAVTLERSLGERWGVALEFAGFGTMSREETEELPVSIAIFPPVPPVEITRRVSQKRLSWNTVAWVSQPAGDRVELVFVGGIAFTRTRFKQSYTATVSPLVLPTRDFITPSTATIEFGVEPIVGIDARLRLTDHLSVVPGLRLQSGGIGGRRGVLVRPSVGVRWGF